MNKLSAKLMSPIALAVSLAATSAIAPMSASAEWTGNIGVHSKYLLRGIYEEDADGAVQGGLDYGNDSGFYAGWWFSSLSYSSSSTSGTGVENDFYGGFAGEMGSVGYDIGLIQYVYVNVDDSDLTELTASLSMGGAYVGMQYLLNDGAWGNSGDIYWKAGYAMDLPSNFGLAFDLGYYTYDDSSNDEMCGVGVPGNVCTTEDGAFRHFNITLSHPVGNTGADMYAQYTVAGKDRVGTEYDDTMVFGLTYGFDI